MNDLKCKGKECSAPPMQTKCKVCHMFLNALCTDCDLKDRIECMSGRGYYKDNWHCRAAGVKELILEALGQDA